MCHSYFSFVTCSCFVYIQMLSLILLFCILGEYAWFDMTETFLVFSYLAKYANHDIDPLVDPLSFKPIFLVSSIMLNLKKKKTMFFLTLRRKKELVDYVKISWEIKCGWVFHLQNYKNGKRKNVDDKVLKWKMIAFSKRATKDKREEKKTKGIVFEIMLYNSFYLTISKTQKS